MDLLLQNHKAKPVCEVPDGLWELCSDISREVIRYQPGDIYLFIADYLDALLITRENANIALKVVENVLMKGEQIAEILAMTGLKLEEIAAAMPRLRNSFREYLDTMNSQKKTCGCDVDSEVGDQCELSICCILRDIGASYQKAQSAAIKIQAAFRGHYERMQLAEKRGEICWQRAAVTTMKILRMIGVTRSEAVHAATVIQSVYRGYYTRRNLNLRKEKRKAMGIVEPTETMDMDTWLLMLFEMTGLTLAKAHKAAKTIQSTYRKYQKRIEDLKYEEELRSQSKVSSKRDEWSSTSTDAASVSKDSAHKMFNITESSEDEVDAKVKELRFRSTINVSEFPLTELEDVEGKEEESIYPLELEGSQEFEDVAEQKEKTTFSEDIQKKTEIELEDNDKTDISQSESNDQIQETDADDTKSHPDISTNESKEQND